MKVLTCKTAAIICALALTNSAFATGWIAHYMPSWISRPVSMAYNYISPHLPATKADARIIQAELKKELSAAELLLKATQETQQEIFAKSKANFEDLVFLEDRSRMFQEKQEAQFLEHYNNLDAIHRSQEINKVNLENNSRQVATLKNQMAQALVSLNNANDALAKSNQNMADQIDAMSHKVDQNHRDLVASLNTHYAKQEQECKLDEKNIGSLHQKVQFSQAQVYKYYEELQSDAKEKHSLIEELKHIAEVLEKQNEKIKKRKERKKNRKNTSFDALHLASSALITPRTDNI